MLSGDRGGEILGITASCLPDKRITSRSPSSPASVTDDHGAKLVTPPDFSSMPTAVNARLTNRVALSVPGGVHGAVFSSLWMQALRIRIGLHGVAGADAVFVAVDVVDASDRGPVFVVAGGGVGVGGGRAGAGVGPTGGGKLRIAIQITGDPVTRRRSQFGRVRTRQSQACLQATEGVKSEWKKLGPWGVPGRLTSAKIAGQPLSLIRELARTPGLECHPGMIRAAWPGNRPPIQKESSVRNGSKFPEFQQNRGLPGNTGIVDECFF